MQHEAAEHTWGPPARWVLGPLRPSAGSARHVAKFLQATVLGSKLCSLIHWILSQFWPPIEKLSKRLPISAGVCASKTWPFCSTCKNLRAQHPVGAKVWSSKNRFEWIWFDYSISEVSWPKFTGLLLPHTKEIAVDQIFVPFWMSLSILEIFALKVWFRPKSGQILHVFGF